MRFPNCMKLPLEQRLVYGVWAARPPDFPYTPPIGRAYEQRGKSDRHHPPVCRRPRALARGQNGSVFPPEHATHRAGIRTEKEERQAHSPVCRKLRVAAQGQNGSVFPPEHATHRAGI